MDRLDFWLVLATIIIACCALLVSILSAAATRKHNRLSVKPILAISTSIVDTPDKKGIYLLNCGFGPAIIRSFEVSFGGVPTNADSVDKLNLEMTKCLNRPKTKFRYSLFNDGDPIQAGERIALFALGPSEYLSEIGEEEKAKFVMGVRGLHWKIKYNLDPWHKKCVKLI